MSSQSRQNALVAAIVAPRFALRRALAASPTSGKAKARAGNALGDLSVQLDQGLNFYIIDIFRRNAGFALLKNPLVKQIWDMLVVLLIPMVIRFLLLGDWSNIWEKVANVLQSGIFWHSSYVRVIEYTEGGNTRMRFNPFEDMQQMVETTDRNNLLQKAIRLYMLERYSLDASEMEANLIPAKKVHMEVKDDGPYGRRASFSGSYTQLMSFVVQFMPKKGQWMLVDKEKQIWFMQFVTEQTQGNDQNPQLQTRTTFHIKGNGPGAGEKVNSWINDAYDFFKEQKKTEQDTSRFFYVAVPSDGSKEKDKGPKTFFKQYLLSDHKTFTSLFFPDKEALLKLIDQFTRKEGKFAIAGFPDKLGLLLDGPPGTGKTSLIKALAHYLNRHVVSVNLARIKTNQELMDLLFDLIFPVQGGDLPVKLKFQDIIFVMEDVDAANKVVYARDGGKKSAKKGNKKSIKESCESAAAKTNQEETMTQEAMKRHADSTAASSNEATAGSSQGEMLPEKDKSKHNDDDDDDVAVNGSAVDAGQGLPANEAHGGARSPPPGMPRLLRMISGTGSRQGEQDTAKVEEVVEESKDAEESGEEEEEEGTQKESKNAEAMVGELICKIMCGPDSGDEQDGKRKATSIMGPWSKSSLYDGDDDLNLAGLLNVLDGVVDSPGRVVVMTTNHPDKLDPALIRPGRINKRIHLGYVNAVSLCQMVEHYMQVTLNGEEHAKLSNLVQRVSVAPAQVEQCCAESDDVNQLIVMLEDLV